DTSGYRDWSSDVCSSDLVVEKGGKPPEAAIRVNPDVLAGGHPHIATGRHEHKFGMDWKEAKRLYLMHGDSKWIRWAGLSAHIGSQITTLEPFRLAVRRLVGYVKELQSQGIDRKSVVEGKRDELGW